MCTLQLKLNKLSNLYQREPWGFISLAVRQRDQVRGISKITGMEKLLLHLNPFLVMFLFIHPENTRKPLLSQGVKNGNIGQKCINEVGCVTKTALRKSPRGMITQQISCSKKLNKIIHAGTQK